MIKITEWYNYTNEKNNYNNNSSSSIIALLRWWTQPSLPQPSLPQHHLVLLRLRPMFVRLRPSLISVANPEARGFFSSQLYTYHRSFDLNTHKYSCIMSHVLFTDSSVWRFRCFADRQPTSGDRIPGITAGLRPRHRHPLTGRCQAEKEKNSAHCHTKNTREPSDKQHMWRLWQETAKIYQLRVPE